MQQLLTVKQLLAQLRGVGRTVVTPRRKVDSMPSLRTTLRTLLLAVMIAVTGVANTAVAASSGSCDEDCPWDGSGTLVACNDDDIGGVWCECSDPHYYFSFGGSC